MKFPSNGQSADSVIQTIESFRVNDLKWRGGRAFGYVYNAGEQIEQVGKDAYMRYLSENALDPTEFPSLLKFENDIISMAADFLGGDEHVVGNFTSGGTESIMLAVKAARDRFTSTHPGVMAEIVVPRTAHAAFFKSAHYLGMKIVIVEVDDDTFKAVPSEMEAACTDNTAMMVGSASSYAHGVVDPIEELAAIAKARDINFHVDGCIGAFVLQFFRKMGADVPAFDFSVDGVTSISMDLHKYAYCPKGASVILHKNKELRKFQIYVCASWSGYTLANATVQSSKTGGPMAAAWAVMHHVGMDGYEAICADLLTCSRQVVAAIRDIDGLQVLSDPQMCLVAFKSTDPEVNVFHITDLMTKRGWYVQAQLSMANSPANIHLTLTPANVPHMTEFIQDLTECVSEARTTPTPQLNPFVLQALQTIDFASLDDTQFAMLLQAAGLGEDGELPEERAEINMILDAMTPYLRERVLAYFFNDLYSQ
ncbi:MAG: sphinganine-1-phosphate aldolase [Kiritimatiellia bacterium]